MKINNTQRMVNRGGRGSLFRFRQWPVYQMSKSFRRKMRDLAKKLPDGDRYLLRDKLSRASDSICFSIAEGSNKLSDVAFGKKVRREGGRL